MSFVTTTMAAMARPRITASDVRKVMRTRPVTLPMFASSTRQRGVRSVPPPDGPATLAISTNASPWRTVLLAQRLQGNWENELRKRKEKTEGEMYPLTVSFSLLDKEGKTFYCKSIRIKNE